jgi:hypothetical protein
VNRLEERDLVISSRPLEATSFEVDGTRTTCVCYESGRSINVMFGLVDGMKRAVGFTLSRRDGGPRGARLALHVRPPEVQAGRHVRGSFSVIRGEY